MQYTLDRQRYAATVWQGVEKPLEIPWFPTSPAFDYNYFLTTPEWAQVGQIWQQDLAKIGVTLTLKPADPVALTSDMIRVTCQGAAVGVGFFGQLHGGVVWTSPYYGPINNRAGFKDDAYTQLTLAVYTDADPAKLKHDFAAWNDYVMDQSFLASIATQYPRALAKSNVHNPVYNTGGTYLDVTGTSLA